MPLLEPAPDNRPQPAPHLKRRYRGCLLGGAVGDALGAPVEFMSLAEIRAQFGRPGITEYTTAFDRKGAITDDTQMTLFTAEGLLRAYVENGGRDARSVTAAVAHAYTRWLRTQGAVPGVQEADTDGWLFEQRELHALRVPGATCLEALQQMTLLGQRADNESKGSGGLMRMAPVGLWCARLDDGVPPDRVARRACELGAELAGVTHGHPTGRLAAGALAALVSLIVRDVPLPMAVERVIALLPRYPGHAETLRALDLARTVARGESALRPETIVTLGEGWVADEALAIAVACALNAEDFETASASRSTTTATATRRRRWRATSSAPCTASRRFRSAGSPAWRRAASSPKSPTTSRRFPTGRSASSSTSPTRATTSASGIRGAEQRRAETDARIACVVPCGLRSRHCELVVTYRAFVETDARIACVVPCALRAGHCARPMVAGAGRRRVEGGDGSDIVRAQRPAHSARDAVCYELGQGALRDTFRSCAETDARIAFVEPRALRAGRALRS